MKRVPMQKGKKIPSVKKVEHSARRPNFSCWEFVQWRFTKRWNSILKVKVHCTLLSALLIHQAFCHYIKLSQVSIFLRCWRLGESGVIVVLLCIFISPLLLNYSISLVVCILESSKIVFKSMHCMSESITAHSLHVRSNLLPFYMV